MNLNIQNSNIDQAEFEKQFDRAGEYTNKLLQILESRDWEADEASILLPEEDGIFNNVESLVVDLQSENLHTILVVGIGGSNLGTMAIYSALRNRLDLVTDELPKIIFVDTLDPQILDDLKEIFSDMEESEEFLVNVISKSGGTTETIANAEFILNIATEFFSEDQVLDRFVLTTDEGSKLWHFAENNDLNKLEIPSKVGGRYSVFSAVGLLPLSLANIDTNEILNGATEFLKKNFEERNMALESAIIQYLHLQNGISIQNTFIFDPNLEQIGKWYRQLMGESIGKRHNINEDEVHAGITPITSIGSTDLHSMAQLYFGGPKDKLTTFLKVNSRSEYMIFNDLFFDGLVDNLSGKSMNSLNKAIYEGVKKAYENNNLPYMEYEMDEVNEFELGAFLQFKMLEIMYLAFLMDLNAFDQPNVEDYKIVTKELLKVD